MNCARAITLTLLAAVGTARSQAHLGSPPESIKKLAHAQWSFDGKQGTHARWGGIRGSRNTHAGSAGAERMARQLWMSANWWNSMGYGEDHNNNRIQPNRASLWPTTPNGSGPCGCSSSTPPSSG